ncbi:MAG: hypothetical protein Kow0047_23410 [Anaerolineae bacterium]
MLALEHVVALAADDEDLDLLAGVEQLADLAGIAGRVIDASNFEIEYAWLDNEGIISEMWLAAQTEAGLCYFDRYGVLRFEAAHHWLGNPEPSYTLTADYYEAVALSPDPDRLVTDVVVEVNRRAPGPSDILFELDEVKRCGPGETITFDARLRYPALSTVKEYEVVSAGGVDLSGYVTFAFTDYGQKVVVQMTNNHPSLEALLVRLDITGQPLIGGPTEEAKAESGLTLSGERVREIRGNPYIQSSWSAGALAELLADRYGRLPRIWRLRGVPGIPDLDLGDRINFEDERSAGGVRSGFVIGYTFRYGSGGFVMDIDVVDGESLYRYEDYFIIGQTAFGSGRAWY